MAEQSWIDAERARCRRPITPSEVPGLELLGTELRRLRREVAGLSRVRLGVCAEMSGRQIEQIERGIRRTRRSTLKRIAAALVQVEPELGDVNALVEQLVELAGAGLAPESDYRYRVERRRERRWSRRHTRRIVYRFPSFQEQLAAELAAGN